MGEHLGSHARLIEAQEIEREVRRERHERELGAEPEEQIEGDRQQNQPGTPVDRFVAGGEGVDHARRCARVCAVDSSINSDGDFTPNSA